MNSQATGRGVAGREAKPANCPIPAPAALPREPRELRLSPSQEQLRVCWGRCLHAHSQSQAFMPEVLSLMGRTLERGHACSAPSSARSTAGSGVRAANKLVAAGGERSIL